MRAGLRHRDKQAVGVGDRERAFASAAVRAVQVMPSGEVIT